MEKRNTAKEKKKRNKEYPYKKIERRSSDKMNKKGTSGEVILLGLIVVVGLICIIAFWVVYPLYNVWSQGLAGKAQLREAEWNRQIAIQEAEAELESAALKKESDIIRAEGIAEANKIISESLTPEYIKWKWVEGLHDGSSEVIYVPTEASLPILEAREQRLP